MKKVRNGVVCFVLAVFLIVVFNFVEMPLPATTAVTSLVVTLLWTFLSNNRAVTNVPDADRNLLLAQAAPAGYGLVYVYRPMKIGGHAIGFDVDLDTVTVAQLKAARFTRLVVAPGSHTMKAGPKKSFGQIAQANKGDTHFAIAAGETVVFRLDMKRGMLQASIDIVREPDTQAGMTALAALTMVAPDKPAASPLMPATSSVSA